jgi:DinB superfamily
VDSRNVERVRLRAERNKLRATDPEGLTGAWAMIEDIWSGTAARARRLPEPVLHEQVDGEWSFVQTNRHLVLATDCWLRRMVKGMAHPYHPWGLAGPWLTSPLRWGLDPDATPSLDQVLDLRRERMDEVSEVIAGSTPNELERNCVPPDSPGHPRGDHTVLECLQVILKEEWQHHRYAVRDLDVLENRGTFRVGSTHSMKAMAASDHATSPSLASRTASRARPFQEEEDHDQQRQ